MSSKKWDLPGGPVVKTPRFHCRGRRFDPLVGELRSRMPHSVAKKLKKKKVVLGKLLIHIKRMKGLPWCSSG